MKAESLIYAGEINRIGVDLCFFDGYKCQIGDSRSLAPTLEFRSPRMIGDGLKSLNYNFESRI